MKRLFVLSFIVFILAVSVGSVAAQDPTPTPIPPICTEFVGQPDQARISYYMGEGAGFYAAGDLSRAVNAFTCILFEIDDTHVPAYMGRAAVLSQRRDFDRAIADYTRAIQLEPSLIGAHNNRGIVYTAMAMYDEALADFNEALSLDADYTLALNNRAVVYALRGEYTDAIADLEGVISTSGIDVALADLTNPDRDEDAPPPEYNLDDAQPYALLGIIYSAYALDNYQRYLRLVGPNADFRVESAAGALESRFTFDLRLDDGSWLLVADFAPEG